MLVKHKFADVDLPCLPGGGTHGFPLSQVRVRKDPSPARGREAGRGETDKGCYFIYPPIPPPPRMKVEEAHWK